MTAASANRNTISDDASLSRLSPSRIVTIDFGTFTLLIIVVADTASGGDIMPPNKKPNASVKPGINQLEATAIRQEVMITIGKAKPVITLRHLKNSFQEACHDAS